MSQNHIIFCFLLAFVCACRPPLPPHEIKGEILLKDKVYLSITTEFILDTPEALKEVHLKSDQLAFAMRLALRDHSSEELKGRGKRNVLNAMNAISRQVLDHQVKDIRITAYDFHQAQPKTPN